MHNNDNFKVKLLLSSIREILSEPQQTIIEEKPRLYTISSNLLEKCIENNEPIYENPLRSIILQETRENCLKISKEILYEKEVISSNYIKSKAKYSSSDNYKEIRKIAVNSLEKSQISSNPATRITDNLDHFVENCLLFLGGKIENSRNLDKKHKKKRKDINFMKNIGNSYGIKFIKPEIVKEYIKFEGKNENNKSIMQKNNEKNEKKEDFIQVISPIMPTHKMNKDIFSPFYSQNEHILDNQNKSLEFSKKDSSDKNNGLVLNLPQKTKQSDNLFVSKGLKLNFIDNINEKPEIPYKTSKNNEKITLNDELSNEFHPQNTDFIDNTFQLEEKNIKETPEEIFKEEYVDDFEMED